MIFIDTGAWYASAVTTDPNHLAAAAFLARNRLPLVTTDYVVDESLTLLRSKGQPARALALGERFFHGQGVGVVFLTPDDIRETWNVFKRFADKAWSFTDCSSKVIMERSGIVQAWFDHHFKQFGTVTVVP